METTQPRFPTYQELATLPTIAEGWTANLVYDDNTDLRIWLSRLGVEDGAPFRSTVTVECWETHMTCVGYADMWVAYDYDGENPPTCIAIEIGSITAHVLPSNIRALVQS